MNFFFCVSLLTVLLSLNGYVTAKYLLVQSEDTKLGAIKPKNRTNLPQHGVFRADDGPINEKTIFLGGSCDGRKWREDVMKQLDTAKISYYNPRRENWTPADKILEDKHKAKSVFQVYLIQNDKSYGLISIFEIYQMGKQGKHVYVHLQDEKAHKPTWPEDNEKPSKITKQVFSLRKYIREAVEGEKLSNVKFFDGADGEKKLTTTLIADWKKYKFIN